MENNSTYLAKHLVAIGAFDVLFALALALGLAARLREEVEA